MGILNLELIKFCQGICKVFYTSALDYNFANIWNDHEHKSQ